MNIIRRNYQPLYIHFSMRFVGDPLLPPQLARLHHLREEETLVCLYLTCSVSISVLTALIMLLEEVPSWAKMVLSLSGKMAITSAYGLIWYYSTELFSTKYRSRVMGEANMCARMSSTFSPYINDIFGEVLVWGPSAVFSLASLVAAFIVTLLPETKNKIMEQGIDDQPEHVVEQHDPPRPQHDPPRPQYDPPRTQHDPLRPQYDPLRPHPKDHEANSQVLLV
ncbi:hypothetical protein Pcinc_000334 [Petrolisthes cinctipes]|uniref:Uncharacterized protein n=1 Tax=Petrolisthes cinctipes TaxID=88211 RepID=A0AAE1GNF4_PETCI|nr:hypothetical protein Pcinc_000334 [Petrolisthes cinctipes]